MAEISRSPKYCVVCAGKLLEGRIRSIRCNQHTKKLTSSVIRLRYAYEASVIFSFAAVLSNFHLTSEASLWSCGKAVLGLVS